MTAWTVTFEVPIEDGAADDEIEAMREAARRVCEGAWDIVTTVTPQEDP